jgi:hypothetical protein
MTKRTRGCVEKATPAKILAAERQAEALELRKSGATFQLIANALGYRNRSSAADAVTRALRDTVPKELVDQVRRLENERLDALWRVAYPLALQGDLRAMDRCLTIRNRRASLNGLDAPVKLRQAIITESDILAAIERLDAESAVLEAPTLGRVATDGQWGTSRARRRIQGHRRGVGRL